jgi:tRNA-specific 2-thiouridylase
LSFYTLGQRKGLGIGGVKGHQQADGTGPVWYVARKDMATNTLYVVEGHDHAWLLSPSLRAGQVSWVDEQAPTPGAYAAKTRYRQSDAGCVLGAANEQDVATSGALSGSLAFADGDGSYPAFKLSFTEQQWAVTPGQSAVLYDGDICLGGGIIV